MEKILATIVFAGSYGISTLNSDRKIQNYHPTWIKRQILNNLILNN